MPRGLKRFLAGHAVTTVQEHGWSSIENGALLTLAGQEFDVFVTADQNIPHQQNLSKFNIAIVILAASSTRIESYEPLADQIRRAVEAAQPGVPQWVTA